MNETNNKYLKEYLKTQAKVDSVLSKPKNGWTIFRIGKTEFELSWMTNLPVYWLDTMIRNFGYSYVVSCECEPGMMDCIVIGRNIHIFYDNRHVASYDFDKDFTRIIMKDIEDNLDAWAEWSHGCWSDQRDITETKKDIQSKLDKLDFLYEEDARQAEERWRRIEENNLRIEAEQSEEDQCEIIEIEPEEIIDLSADHQSV